MDTSRRRCNLFADSRRLNELPAAVGRPQSSIRAEAFNLTNSVRFRPDLFGTTALENPGSFGNHNTVMTSARVLQFGLRYEF